MILRRSKEFEKNFRKRISVNQKLCAQFEARLEMFLAGHRGQPINDHALTGVLKGMRAFSVNGDVRVIYIESSGQVVLIDIGTHAQVYK